MIECKRFLLAHQWQIRLQFVSNAKGRRRERERERERGAEKKSRSLRQKCDEKERRKWVEGWWRGSSWQVCSPRISAAEVFISSFSNIITRIVNGITCNDTTHYWPPTTYGDLKEYPDNYDTYRTITILLIKNRGIVFVLKYCKSITFASFEYESIGKISK